MTPAIARDLRSRPLRILGKIVNSKEIHNQLLVFRGELPQHDGLGKLRLAKGFRIGESSRILNDRGGFGSSRPEGPHRGVAYTDRARKQKKEKPFPEKLWPSCAPSGSVVVRTNSR